MRSPRFPPWATLGRATPVSRVSLRCPGTGGDPSGLRGGERMGYNNPTLIYSAGGGGGEEEGAFKGATQGGNSCKAGFMKQCRLSCRYMH